MMTRAEYIEECQALIDSFDDHVDGGMAAFALRELADRVESEGLADWDDEPNDLPQPEER